MATAKKLPSGSWRCRVFSHYENVLQEDGTLKQVPKYKSFTSKDPSKRGKKEAELMAAEYAAGRKRDDSCMTLGECMDDYIENRSGVLSPGTLRNYKQYRQTAYAPIINLRIHDITQDMIQGVVNMETAGHTPKTVKNMHGFLSATMAQYRPEFALHTTLPKKKKPDLYIPTDADIKVLLEHTQGTDMELPILLAAFGPMRRGEIAALRIENISGNTVHVCENMVRAGANDRGLKWIIKQPKSAAGDRYIPFPDEVAEKWSGVKYGRVVNLNPTQITDRFIDIVKEAGLHHMRFHDLRHYSASKQHALGIPDSYIMSRGGWGSDGVLKSVYRHTMEDSQKLMNDRANEHFSSLYATKYATE